MIDETYADVDSCDNCNAFLPDKNQRHSYNGSCLCEQCFGNAVHLFD